MQTDAIIGSNGWRKAAPQLAGSAAVTQGSRS
jgi:hypothetical protein